MKPHSFGVLIETNTCTLADGLATAVMVLGHSKGLALDDRLEGVEGIIIPKDLRSADRADPFN